MSNNKHTKGPWSVALKFDGEAPIYRLCVAVRPEEEKPNAHLIAAAPDLLEALIDAESAMFHVLADDGFNTPQDRESMRLARDKARVALEKAIAKAKGGNQ